MDQQFSEGTRLVAFEGGGLHAVSQLILLKEVMRRVEWDRKSKFPILPCTYFHMMAGVGTGGIIVILLAVLCMDVEETINEFLNIWRTVFTDADLSQVARSEKLESTMKDLLRRKAVSVNSKLKFGEEDDSCKAFVCAVPQANLGLCQKMRTYGPRDLSLNPTIIEAVRATCAIPSLFTPASIDSIGCKVNYITGIYNFNNPTWEMVKEACDYFGRHCPVACALSLGCGRMPTLNISSEGNGASISDIIEEIALDCEIVDRDLRWRIGNSNVYHRLCLDRVFNRNGDISMIVSTAMTFLEQPAVSASIDQCVAAAEHVAGVTMKDLGGLNEQRPASAIDLPLLSTSFVERPTLIKEMAGGLFHIGHGTQRRMVLSGLGGIGKTQIVIKFLHQFLSRFRHILFIDASTVESIEGGIIGKLKSLGNAYTRTSAKKALMLLSNPDQEITRDWVIVYDNLNDPDIKVASYFPPCTFGTIIITTRNPYYGNLAPDAHIVMDIMSEDEAVDVLLKAAIRQPHIPTEDNRKRARAIAVKLGCLPVALVQAGYFINVHDCMESYLERLDTRRPDILNRPALNQIDEHYHGIYDALEVTWPSLTQSAQHCLSILGFVNYAAFPIILVYRAAARHFQCESFSYAERATEFQESVKLLCDTFRPQASWNEQDVDDLIVQLEQYSLVTRMSTYNMPMLRLHPLVHSWAHDRLNAAERNKYQNAAIRLLMCCTSKGDRDIFEFIYPHISLYLNRLGDFHADDRAGVAGVLLLEGSIQKAAQIWEGILGYIQADGQNDLRVTEAKLHLASAYHRLGESLPAVRLESQVVTWRMKVMGPDSPMTINALAQQARAMGEAGLPMLHHVVAFWKRRDGNNQEEILRAKEDVAVLSHGFDSFEVWKDVLEGRAEYSGSDHWMTLQAMAGMATAYGSSFILTPYISSYALRIQTREGNRFAAAAKLWESLVAVCTKRRGMRHPDTISAIENLAQSCNSQGLYDDAIKHWKRALHLRKKIGIFKDTLIPMNRLAILYVLLKRHTEADTLWKELVELRQTEQGPFHEDTLSDMASLAQQYIDWEWYEEAEAQWKEVIKIREKAHGRSHDSVLDSRDQLARLYKMLGRYAEAEAQWQAAMAARQMSQDPYGEGRLRDMEKLAKVYARWGWYVKAEEQWRELISLRKKAGGSSPKALFDSRVQLARLFVMQARYAEAEAQWQEAICGVKEMVGVSHEATLDALSALAEEYTRWEWYMQAEAQWKEVICLRKEVQGPTHTETVVSINKLAVLSAERLRYSEEAAAWRDERASILGSIL